MAIHTEFQKKGRKPLQSAPVQALDQASRQALTLRLPGKLSRLPLRNSSASLREVTTITYSGARKNAAPSRRTPISNTRAT